MTARRKTFVLVGTVRPRTKRGTPTVQYGFPDTPLAAWGTDAYTAEAPQRELDRQKKVAADAAVAQEKAKSENKAQFRP